MGYFPAFDLLLNENAPESRRSAHKKTPVAHGLADRRAFNQKNAPLARSRANFSRFR